jgi:hypothetical protein
MPTPPTHAASSSLKQQTQQQQQQQQQQEEMPPPTHLPLPQAHSQAVCPHGMMPPSHLVEPAILAGTLAGTFLPIRRAARPASLAGAGSRAGRRLNLQQHQQQGVWRGLLLIKQTPRGGLEGVAPWRAARTAAAAAAVAGVCG